MSELYHHCSHRSTLQARVLQLGHARASQLHFRRIVITIAQATIEASIREVNARGAAQQDRWERMQRVIDERAQDPDHLVASGGSTGLLVREVRDRVVRARLSHQHGEQAGGGIQAGHGEVGRSEPERPSSARRRPSGRGPGGEVPARRREAAARRRW